MFTGPGDGQLTDFEGRHIQSLRDRHFLFKFKILQIGRTDGRHLWQNIFRRFGPNLTSNSARHGCVLYSLYLHKTKEDPIPYLNKFYEGTREAIKLNAVDDVVYGCYAICMYGLHTGLDFRQIMKHATGFRVGLMSLVKEFVDEELFLLECMWEKLVWFMAIDTVFRNNCSREYLEFLERFCEPIVFPTWRMCPPWVNEALTTLRVKIQFVRFVVAIQLHGIPEISDLLSTAISSLNAFVDQIPNPFAFDWIPSGLWKRVDLSVRCLALLGLTSAMLRLENQLGTPIPQRITLIN